MGNKFRYNVKKTISDKDTVLARNISFEEAIILTEMLQQRHELDYRIKVALNEITEEEMKEEILITEFNYEKI